MKTNPPPVHTAAGTGKTYLGPGDMYTFLLTGAQSGDAYFVVEANVPPGGGPPLHIHEREDETFYILEGECSFQIGDSKLRASAGDFIFAPRGIAHAFTNEGNSTLRMIMTFAPAGIEKYFEEVFEPATDPSATPPPLTQELLDRLLKAAPRYGIEFLLPDQA